MTFCSLQNHKDACPLGKVLNTQLSGGRVEAGDPVDLWNQLVRVCWGHQCVLCCASRKDPHFLALAEAAFGSISASRFFLHRKSTCISFWVHGPGTRVANAAIA